MTRADDVQRANFPNNSSLNVYHTSHSCSKIIIIILYLVHSPFKCNNYIDNTGILSIIF